MAVNETVDGYSTTAASNTPSGSDNVGPDLDNHLRDIKKNIRIMGEISQAPAASAPTGFLGRLQLDTSATASSRLVMRIHDGSGYIDFMEIDASANQATPYVGGAVMGTLGQEMAQAGTTASGRTVLGFGGAQNFVEDSDLASNFVKADATTDMSAGVTAAVVDNGTKASGTFTPAFATGNLQKYVNGGAHTLAPPSINAGTMVIQITNNASAGSITTSGFTQVTGDSFTTTNGHDFMAYVVVVGSFSHLHITALQ